MDVPPELVGGSGRFALGPEVFVGENDRADVMLPAQPQAGAGEATVTAAVGEYGALVEAQAPPAHIFRHGAVANTPAWPLAPRQ